MLLLHSSALIVTLHGDWFSGLDAVTPELAGLTTALFRYSGGSPGAVVLRHSSFKETKCFFPAHSWRLNIVGSLSDREVASSAADYQGWNLESCVCGAVSSHSSHHPQEVLLAQSSLYVHKGGLKPHSFHFCRCSDFKETNIFSSRFFNKNYAL